MAPQIFSSTTFGLSTNTNTNTSADTNANSEQQTGPSPLIALLAAPIKFVKELTAHNEERSGSEQKSKKKRVLTLTQYKIWKDEGFGFNGTSVKNGGGAKNAAHDPTTPRKSSEESDSSSPSSSSGESTPEPSTSTAEVISTKSSAVNEQHDTVKNACSETNSISASQNENVSVPTVERLAAQSRKPSVTSTSEVKDESEKLRNERSSPAENERGLASKIIGKRRSPSPTEKEKSSVEELTQRESTPLPEKEKTPAEKIPRKNESTSPFPDEEQGPAKKKARKHISASPSGQEQNPADRLSERRQSASSTEKEQEKISRKRRSTSPPDVEQAPSKKYKASVETPKAMSLGPKSTPTNGTPAKLKSLPNTAKSGPTITVLKRFPDDLAKRTARGITNKGLWCYRNSIIQALVHVPGLYGYLSTHDRDESDKCANPGVGCICCLLRAFMNSHFSDDEEEDVNKKQRAIEIIDRLLGGEFARTGLRHEQQDADEYVIRMLDKAVEQQKKGNPGKKIALEQLLEITTTQKVTCCNKNCKHSSETKSYSTSMRTKITQPQFAVRLTDLVQDLEASEAIKDYKCEKCGQLGATIERRFTKLPPALMVHVNRCGRSNFRGQSIKLNNWLQFEPELTVNMSDGTSHKYVLRSVVSHVGQSLHSGHYVCFARNPDNTTWSLCDDRTVTTVPEGKFTGAQDGKPPRYSAYILMYSKA